MKLSKLLLCSFLAIFFSANALMAMELKEEDPTKNTKVLYIPDEILELIFSYFPKTARLITHRSKNRYDKVGIHITISEDNFMRLICYINENLDNKFLSDIKNLRVKPGTGYEYIINILPKLDYFRNLEELYLSYTETTFNSLSALPNLPNLKTLNLKEIDTYTYSGGELFIPECLNNICELNLANNHIKDSDLPLLTALKNLTYLNLKSNSVSEKGLDTLAKLISLKRLDLTDNLLDLRKNGVENAKSKLPHIVVIIDNSYLDGVSAKPADEIDVLSEQFELYKQVTGQSISIEEYLFNIVGITNNYTENSEETPNTEDELDEMFSKYPDSFNNYDE